MKSKWVKAIVNSAIYMASWYCIYFFTLIFFKNSPANQAYGLLNGWWFALYISQFLGKNIIVLSIICVIHFCFLLLNVFHIHDFSIEDMDLFFYFGNLFIFMSPILINIGIEFVAQKAKKRASPV